MKHLHDHDSVEIVLMTNGEKGTLLKSRQGEEIKKLREEETDQRMKLIPAVKLTKLNLPDAGMAVSKETCTKSIGNPSENETRHNLSSGNQKLVYLPESSRS